MIKYSEKELMKIVKKVTNESDVNWYCRIYKDKILLGNDYFDVSEFFIIKKVFYNEVDYIEITLNYTNDTLPLIKIKNNLNSKEFYKLFNHIVENCFLYFNVYC